MLSRESLARAMSRRVPYFVSLAVLSLAAVSSMALRPHQAGELEKRPSVLDSQVVVYYGTPTAPGLGILGRFEIEEAGRELQAHAKRIDELNGERGATGAVELIYGMATAELGPNGNHISYMKDDIVEEYIDLAERRDLQVILDLHIGQSDPLTEVRRIERFLEHPRVHVAIDAEYAVGPGGVPLSTLGKITGDEINDVQKYVDDLTREHNLPKKMVIMHQFMDETVIDGEKIDRYDNVDFVLNMDAWGDIASKHERYRHFASQPWAHNVSYNIFMHLDERVEEDSELVKLSPIADMFMYQ